MININQFLVSTRIVLTAAHCLLTHNNPTTVGVLAGDSDYMIGMSGSNIRCFTNNTQKYVFS